MVAYPSLQFQDRAATPPLDEPTFTNTVEPTVGWVPLNLGQLWQYRELLYFLTWRDLKVRYKQTALGAAWAVLQPLLTMLIFAVVFGHFARIPSEGVPYALFCYCGLVPWTFFAFAMGQSANSLVGNSSLIAKVYFPRLVIPIAAALAGLLDFAIAFAVLLCMLLFYGVAPTWYILTLPLFTLLALAAALAVGIWLSALNVQYRDVRYTIVFLTQIWLYATPIAYPADMIRGPLHLALALNPMTGVVEGFRMAILGTGSLDAGTLALSVTATVVALLGSLVYFRRMEQRFADII
jgi:homopolymeric O-antigen transport system permease protein